MSNTLLYDMKKTFEENRELAPFFTAEIPERVWKPKDQWLDFLGYKIASPIGVPASSVAITSKGVELCSRLGFDVITYKTIRSSRSYAHPKPNLGYIQASRQLTVADLHTTISHRKEPYATMRDLAMTISIGNASADLQWVLPDIERARQLLHEGQVLIVSVFGTEKERDQVEDFAYLAAQAGDAGAHIVEANLSCPNIGGGKGILYLDPEQVYKISVRMVRELKGIPLLIKVGIFSNNVLMQKIMVAAAQAGVQGVTGINAIGMHVVNEQGKPFFGQVRNVSGLCGAPIRDLALQFVQQAQQINQREKLDLTILATGGVTLPEHFHNLLCAGADVAMSATGALWDPYLAMKYHDLFSAMTLTNAKKATTEVLR